MRRFIVVCAALPAWSADLPPVAMMISPWDDDTVSGGVLWMVQAEDDWGTVRADFFVDGIRVYTDTNGFNHFHYGGDHDSVWNTASVPDGPHQLLARVYDTADQWAEDTVIIYVKNLFNGAQTSRGRVRPVLSAFPNPFSGQTRLSFEWPGNTAVKTLSLYDAAGRLGARFSGFDAAPGPHSIVLDRKGFAGRRLASGAYLIQIEGGGFRLNRTISILN